MTMKGTTLLFVLSLFGYLVKSQDLQVTLNGFRLGQYRDVPENEYGAPIQNGKYDDGYEYEAYAVEPDTSVYMIFEYARSDLNVIWSLQVTGSKAGYDCQFKGLKLGMSSDEVKNILGKPSRKVNINEYGHRWEYNNTNYSVEINPDGKLSSIKIMDLSDDYYQEPDPSKIPSFQKYSAILVSGDRNQLADLLAPDIEIYKDDSVHYFKRSIRTEVSSDASGIFRLVDEMNKTIKDTDPRDTLAYEENVRLILGQDPMHVAKFTLNKKYSEIVFKWMFGRYMIWEIKLN